MAKRKSGDAKPKAARPRKSRKPKGPAPKALGAADVPFAGEVPAELEELARAVGADGGAVLARYREPYGAHAVLLVALPIEKVEPTPYQRNVSPAHVAKLGRSIEKVGRFLDPVIAVRHDGRYWVPNGGHRLAALRAAQGRSIVALLIPEPEVSWKILALNTEKAHNLKERSLEVVRLERALVAAGETLLETSFEVELEEGALVTLGIAYEKRPRLAGGAYAPLLRRVDPLRTEPLAKALAARERLADRLLAADDVIGKIIERLKARGMRSPYLRSFVVARVSPIPRFGPARDAPALPVEEALEKLIERASRFDTERVKETDVAATGGPPPEEGS